MQKFHQFDYFGPTSSATMPWAWVMTHLNAWISCNDLGICDVTPANPVRRNQTPRACTQKHEIVISLWIEKNAQQKQVNNETMHEY